MRTIHAVNGFALRRNRSSPVTIKRKPAIAVRRPLLAARQRPLRSYADKHPICGKTLANTDLFMHVDETPTLLKPSR